MAQGRSTKIISMIKWIRTSRLSIKNSLSEVGEAIARMWWVAVSKKRTFSPTSAREALAQAASPPILGIRELPSNGCAVRKDPPSLRETEFFIDNLLVRIHFIIVMIRWTGLAPWEFELRSFLSREIHARDEFVETDLDHYQHGRHVPPLRLSNKFFYSINHSTNTVIVVGLLGTNVNQNVERRRLHPG